MAASTSTSSASSVSLAATQLATEATDLVGTPSLYGGRTGEPPMSWEKSQVSIKESPAQAAREVERPREGTDPEAIREEMQSLARKARDSFRDACEATEEDRADSSYLTMRASLEELWRFAKYRDVAFRDLLAILDAATRYTELRSFDIYQRDVLRGAFQELPIWHVGIEEVDSTIEKFAEFAIDITGPIQQNQGKKFRIRIEEVE